MYSEVARGVGPIPVDGQGQLLHQLSELALRLALCLEQARVLDADPDARCDRGQQPGVGLAETPLVAGALDADDPDRRLADDDRDAEVRARRCSHGPDLSFLRHLVEQEGLGGLQDA